jgi:phosphoribosylaminoimidazole-succinocarboxamide synthase
MTFPRLRGLRTMELGSPGPMRTRLNELVRSGAKVATFGHPAEYLAEGEPYEHLGERLVLVDDDGGDVGTIEVTEVRRCRVADVTWELVEAEGEGDESVAQWRAGHSAYWESLGYPMDDDQELLWIRFRLVDPLLPVPRTTAGDLGLPEGYRHAYSGKVRDLFTTPSGDLLFVASDRISAYDWVLPTPIPDKGAILTAMSLWWFEQMADLVGNHVRSLDVPAGVAGRAMVCRPLAMFPVECVVRGYLTGSGLTDYRSTGEVCGIPLPAGLTDGSALPAPIFTPATKAVVGDHDENIDYAAVERAIGAADAEGLRGLSLAVYSRAAEQARARGIILADTKFEFGRDPDSGAILLADEVLTPDSSRFWPAEQWQPGRPQPSFDKQYVRDWLTSPASGWDRSGTEPPPQLPDAVVAGTRDRYLAAYRRLTGGEWTPATP